MIKTKFEKIYSINQILETASELLENFEQHKIFCFTGNLGAGKTTFITSLCRVLGSADNITSPTFSLVNEYNSDKGLIYHFDLYRLKNQEEAMDVGLEEYIYSNNYCVMEWPEKVADILPLHLVVNCELSYLSLNERKLKAWVN
ncbi:MAG: tRNA (adenosine(37)-N6)-threonylcarbamoyltransferase complex ATPase subunit type 1 TsaE [Bacteroidia bacterium]